MHATAEDVGLVLREKRAALIEARRQIDVATTGPQARAILNSMVDELDHDLRLLAGSADVVACLAAELGISARVVPVTEASGVRS
jgi:hypothetical protein